MVSDKIVSRYTDGFPGADATARGIAGGPLYPRAEVLRLLADSGGQCILAWTKKCTADIQKLALDADELDGLLREALSSGRFIGSEWCQQQPDGPWAACDAYQLMRQEWVAAAHRDMAVEYYLKFAIGKTGAILLLVSCHLSK